ncbi:unnamed protein product [Urochloa humidicola]
MCATHCVQSLFHAADSSVHRREANGGACVWWGGGLKPPYPRYSIEVWSKREKEAGRKRRGYFGSNPGNLAWRRQRSQAFDFECLRLRALPSSGAAWEASNQTKPEVPLPSGLRP